MNQRVPENNELFPTEVDALVSAARFNAFLIQILGDFRRVLL